MSVSLVKTKNRPRVLPCYSRLQEAPAPIPVNAWVHCSLLSQFSAHPTIQSSTQPYNEIYYNAHCHFASLLQESSAAPPSSFTSDENWNTRPGPSGVLLSRASEAYLLYRADASTLAVALTLVLIALSSSRMTEAYAQAK